MVRLDFLQKLSVHGNVSVRKEERNEVKGPHGHPSYIDLFLERWLITNSVDRICLTKIQYLQHDFRAHIDFGACATFSTLLRTKTEIELVVFRCSQQPQPINVENILYHYYCSTTRYAERQMRCLNHARCALLHAAVLTVV